MKKRSFFNIIFSIMMSLSIFSTSFYPVFADSENQTTEETGESEETEANELSKSKKSSKYELSADDDTTEITLSMPSDEYKDTFDIVFVVDASNVSQQVEDKASELLKDLLGEDLNINIGVIKFKGRPQDTIETVSGGSYKELAALNEDSKDYILEAIDFNPDTDPRSATGNGTNLHSPLLLAQKWLDASDTPDDHKYVVMLTDARSYIFDDGKGGPACIYAQYERQGMTTNRLQNGGVPVIGSQVQGDKYHTTFMANNYFLADSDLDATFHEKLVSFGTAASHSAADFQILYDSTNSELTGDSPYQTTCYYVDSGTAKTNRLDATVTKNAVANWRTYYKSGATLYESFYSVSLNSGSDPYLHLSPVKTELDTATGAYTYTGELDEDAWFFHVSSEEKSLYMSAHVWTDLGKYHNISIGYDRGYQNGLETTMDFLAWLPENSYAYAEVKDTSAVSQIFTQLENEIIHAVGKAVVKDTIPDYLDLVEDAYSGIPFELSVGGETQTPIEIAENDWAFGTADETGLYPYEIVWDADSNTFTLNINVPIENAKKVNLKYQLQWNGTGEEDTDVDTNAETTIEYWPSNNTEGDSKTENFESPVVIYSAVQPTPEPEPQPEPRPQPLPTPELPKTGLGHPRAQKPASVNYHPLQMSLLIPSLNIETRIVRVAPVDGKYPIDWLDQDAGLLADSALPGEGAAIIAAHNTLDTDTYGPFARIAELGIGDVIFVRADEGALLSFEIFENEKIGANDFEALYSAAGQYDSTVTLITCEDEMISGGYASRRIISARQK